MNCIMNAPTTSSGVVGANAQSGIATIARSSAVTIARRRPTVSE